MLINNSCPLGHFVFWLRHWTQSRKIVTFLHWYFPRTWERCLCVLKTVLFIGTGGHLVYWYMRCSPALLHSMITVWLLPNRTLGCRNFVLVFFVAFRLFLWSFFLVAKQILCRFTKRFCRGKLCSHSISPEGKKKGFHLGLECPYCSDHIHSATVLCAVKKKLQIDIFSKNKAKRDTDLAISIFQKRKSYIGFPIQSVQK